MDSRVRDRLAGDSSGIHSVEVSAHILMQLANFRQPTSLKKLSDRCKLTPSKVHRYLSSLTKVGLVFQGEKSGNYSLGKSAIILGLAAMQHIDQIDDVMEGLPQLVMEMGCHISLTVWSKTGPTLIKVERSDDSLAVPLLLGQALPVLRSASGRMFAAFLDRTVTRELVAAERLSHGDSTEFSESELQTILFEIRKSGISISVREVESETTAIATPVLDWQDSPVVVVTAMISKYSSKEKIDFTANGIREFAQQKSAQRPTFPFES